MHTRTTKLTVFGALLVAVAVLSTVVATAAGAAVKVLPSESPDFNFAGPVELIEQSDNVGQTFVAFPEGVKWISTGCADQLKDLDVTVVSLPHSAIKKMTDAPAHHNCETAVTLASQLELLDVTYTNVGADGIVLTTPELEVEVLPGSVSEPSVLTIAEFKVPGYDTPVFDVHIEPDTWQGEVILRTPDTGSTELRHLLSTGEWVTEPLTKVNGKLEARVTSLSCFSLRRIGFLKIPTINQRCVDAAKAVKDEAVLLAKKVANKGAIGCAVGTVGGGVIAAKSGGLLTAASAKLIAVSCAKGVAGEVILDTAAEQFVPQFDIEPEPRPRTTTTQKPEPKLETRPQNAATSPSTATKLPTSSSSAKSTPTAPGSPTVSKGASVYASDCTHSSCAKITVRAPSSGSHDVQIWSSRFGKFASYEFTGSSTSRYYYGYPNDTVWVVVDGVKSNIITW